MATAGRLEVLRTVPAALRHVSAEPLLGPLDELDLEGIDWLIAGGESGPSRRPVRAEWLRGLRDHCLKAGVAFTFKGWGGSVQGVLGRTLDGREWDECPAAVRGETAADGEGEGQATLWDVSSAGSEPAGRLPSPSVSTS
jgi:protein gp37